MVGLDEWWHVYTIGRIDVHPEPKPLRIVPLWSLDEQRKVVQSHLYVFFFFFSISMEVINVREPIVYAYRRHLPFVVLLRTASLCSVTINDACTRQPRSPRFGGARQVKDGSLKSIQPPFYCRYLCM